MKLSGRRKFIKQSAFAGASLALPMTNWINTPEVRRKFKLSLNPSAIGVNLSQLQMIEAAGKFGFEAIIPLAAEISAMSETQIDSVLGQMSEFKLTWDAAGLPVDFRNDEVIFRQGLLRLQEVGAALKNVGVTRMSTWIMPTHAGYTYRKNFEVHVRRISLMAEVLADFDIKLGKTVVIHRSKEGDDVIIALFKHDLIK